jgi:NADPH-dependent 2,4-dienoyl-CoA reductase/sulfur reductase-like enzyme
MTASVGTRECDIAVIGGGPAGLAAALGARREGADVLLLDREPRLGGILNQCIHDGFGLFLYNESISGPEYAERLMEDVGREGIRVETGAMVLDLSPDRTLRVNSRSGYGVVRAKSVVLAMGCRERTREMIEIPGDRPAGVWTAGSAQHLVNLQNIRIGREAVILGSGDIGLIMARRLTLEGMVVKGVFEIRPWVGGLERNVRQCLQDFGIPLELSTTVLEIRGRDRISSAVVGRVDGALRPIAGTEREIPCDTLLLSVGLIPENELSKRAGVELSPITGGAVVDETFMTSIPGIFSCGNVLQIHDLADWASFEGFAAGKNAATFAGSGRNDGGAVLRFGPGAGIHYVLPQIVGRGATGFDLHFRVTEPRKNVWIEARGTGSGRIYFRRKYFRLLPSELQKITWTTDAGEDVEVAAHE